MGRKERHLVGLDLGTSKVAAIVGEVMGNGEVEIIGLGVAESQGIRRGAVVNQEAAVESIRKAVEAAELTAGIEIDNVYVSLSGTHIKGFNSRGVVAVAGRNREITRDDVRRAIDAARAVSLPGGREILHVLPQDFVVDDEDGIGEPDRDDRRPPRGQRPHRDRRRDDHAEHRDAASTRPASTCRSRCSSSSRRARPC